MRCSGTKESRRGANFSLAPKSATNQAITSCCIAAEPKCNSTLTTQVLTALQPTFTPQKNPSREATLRWWTWILTPCQGWPPPPPPHWHPNPPDRGVLPPFLYPAAPNSPKQVLFIDFRLQSRYHLHTWSPWVKGSSKGARRGRQVCRVGFGGLRLLVL